MQNVNSYNLSTGNKWILSIPYKVLDKTTTMSDIVLNLFKFEPPEFKSGNITLFLQGVSYPIPTHVRDEEKKVSVKYKPSADFRQLKFIYAWFNAISDEDGYTNTGGSHMKYAGDVTATFLSQYKSPIFSITYHDCYITDIESIDMDYQTDGETLTHGFSLRYSHYTVDGLIEKEDCP